MRQLSFEISPTAPPLSSSVREQIEHSARGNGLSSTSKGSLTEVIVGEGSALQPCQLLPILVHGNDHQRWLMWLSPSQAMNKRWLVNAGLQSSPVLHVSIDTDTQQELCAKALISAKSHLIIEWTGSLDKETRAQLRAIAEQNGTHLFLIRCE